MEDKNKHTPLYYAIKYNHKSIYEYILNKLQIKIPDNFVTSVYKAALDGNLPCLILLHDNCKFSLCIPDKNGKLPLYYACKSGNMETIKYCDENKPQELKGILPIKFEPNPFKASKEGDISSLEYLIETAGFDIREKDEQSGFDILQIACIERQSEIVKYCVKQLKFPEKLPDLPKNFESNIDKASSSGNFESVEYLFKYVNLSEEQKRSALYNSCNSNYLPIFQFLIKNGMNLDTKFSEPFSTPLHVLCGIQKMNIPFIDFIIKSAKDKAKIVEAKNIQRLTPLHIASLSGNLYTVIYLIENAEANKEAETKAHYTPVLSATEKGHLNIVKYLIEKAGVNIACKTRNGTTLTQMAVKHDYLECYDYLVSKGCPYVKGVGKPKDYETNLHKAVKNQKISSVQYLIENENTNQESKDENGKTALHIACENGYFQITKYLIEEAHCDVNSRTNSAPNGEGNETPLHLACKNRKLQIIKYLIENGKADINARDNKGNTIYDIASAAKCEEICSYLMKIKNSKESLSCPGSPVKQSSKIQIKKKVSNTINN